METTSNLRPSKAFPSMADSAVTHAAPARVSKPHALALRSATSQASLERSTKPANAAPREMASMPTEPPPQNVSRTATFRGALNTPIEMSVENMLSRTRPIIGLNIVDGDSRRRPRASPAMTRSLDVSCGFSLADDWGLARGEFCLYRKLRRTLRGSSGMSCLPSVALRG